MIESTNEHLSFWNVRTVVIDKIENFTSKNESRITFDYFKISKKMSNNHLKFSNKIHDHLFHSKHRNLFVVDLKHVYLIVFFHSNDRHYFFFTISRIEQMQFTRMQQKFKSIEFTMTELVYRKFDHFSSSHKKSFLLHSNQVNKLLSLTFYMNDFFDEFISFENQYDFFRNHFFSRIEWIRLRLSFKKLKMFMIEIIALKITHFVNEFVRISNDQIAKIMRYFKSIKLSDVRDFLKMIDIIRRWMKNFTKLTKSLTKFIDKIDWKWIDAKNLFFEILKIKCITKTTMHDIDLVLVIHFYTNVSNYDVDLIIIQFQRVIDVDIAKNKSIKISILYDAFALRLTRRKYFIYKKKLYDIVMFVIKYNYFCKYSYLSIVIHTNHKSLIYFLKFDLHEEIYNH